MGEGFIDGVISKATLTGMYLAKSVCHIVGMFNYANYDIRKKIWLGYAPSKVEIFVWQLMWEKIAMKYELVLRKLIGENQMICVLSNRHLETINHLFFTCEEAWSVWGLWLSYWNFSWVSPFNAKISF